MQELQATRDVQASDFVDKEPLRWAATGDKRTDTIRQMEGCRARPQSQEKLTTGVPLRQTTSIRDQQQILNEKINNFTLLYNIHNCQFNNNNKVWIKYFHFTKHFREEAFFKREGNEVI